MQVIGKNVTFAIIHHICYYNKKESSFYFMDKHFNGNRDW